MRKAWTPPARWVFGVATVLGSLLLSAGVSADRSQLQSRGCRSRSGKLLILNLALWYIPALLMPAIVARRAAIPLDGGRTSCARSPCTSAARCSSRSCRFVGMLGVRFLLWSDGGGKPRGCDLDVSAARSSSSRLDWSLMVYAVIVGVSHAVAYYHESQERKLKAAQLETRLIEAQLKTLQAELHPHFLFNTLHAISTLIHRDPESADRMISRLSDLLRITFDRSGEPKITLKEEIEFLQKYLDIEQTRFPDRLVVRVEIDPDVARRRSAADDPAAARRERDQARHRGRRPIGGHLQIVAGPRSATRCGWRCATTAAGCTARTLKALRTGVGLSNTRARLECLYGRHHRLEFTDLHGGLAVLIEIPVPARTAAAPSATAFRVA